MQITMSEAFKSVLRGQTVSGVDVAEKDTSDLSSAKQIMPLSIQKLQLGGEEETVKALTKCKNHFGIFVGFSESSAEELNLRIKGEWYAKVCNISVFHTESIPVITLAFIVQKLLQKLVFIILKLITAYFTHYTKSRHDYCLKGYKK